MSRNKLKVFMRNPRASNELANTGIENVNISIPQRLVECIGVCHINPDITDEELLQMKSFEKSKLYQLVNPKVINACRINKQSNQWTVTVTFSGKQLPSHVELDRCLFPVREYYYYPVRQCFGRWRFGHSVKQCKSAKRCANCGKTHESEDEYNQCGEPVRCVHCQGNHPSNDKNCEVQKKKKRDNKQKQEADKEKDPVGEWPCFSQGAVDNHVPQDQDPVVNFEAEIPLPKVQSKKRKNSTAGAEEIEIINDARTFQFDVEQIIKCASEIVVGLRPKEDMALLISSQFSNPDDGDGPVLRL